MMIQLMKKVRKKVETGCRTAAVGVALVSFFHHPYSFDTSSHRGATYVALVVVTVHLPIELKDGRGHIVSKQGGRVAWPEAKRGMTSVSVAEAVTQSMTYGYTENGSFCLALSRIIARVGFTRAGNVMHLLYVDKSANFS